MCTAITYETRDFYFGRTLDYEFTYGEEITITPRCYPFTFHYVKPQHEHYAMIGMAHIAENQPLYYDAVNEKGLGMAGLNFVGNACYRDKTEGKHNVAPYELIPWILGQCATVEEAQGLLIGLNVTAIPFHDKLPLADLHWILSGHGKTITLETAPDGVRIYDNPVGVLTNNPPFDKQMFCLNNYINLSAREPENRFSSKLALDRYSRGMGAIGLPGDLSSQSRFVRAAFVKLNSVSGDSELDSVNQFFHILGSVEQQRGCCDLGEGKYAITFYTSCCNATKGIYYYTTYGNHQISAVDIKRAPLDGANLIRYPLIKEERIHMQN